MKSKLVKLYLFVVIQQISRIHLKIRFESIRVFLR